MHFNCIVFFSFCDFINEESLSEYLYVKVKLCFCSWRTYMSFFFKTYRLEFQINNKYLTSNKRIFRKLLSLHFELFRGWQLSLPSFSWLQYSEDFPHVNVNYCDLLFPYTLIFIEEIVNHFSSRSLNLNLLSSGLHQKWHETAVSTTHSNLTYYNLGQVKFIWLSLNVFEN